MISADIQYDVTTESQLPQLEALADTTNADQPSVKNNPFPMTPEVGVDARINPLLLGTSNDDVCECYRLLLDREPEETAVILEKTGRPMIVVILDILISDEFGSRNHDTLLQLFG